MNWTTETPTQPGMYWVQHRLPEQTTWFDLAVWICFIEPAHPAFNEPAKVCLIDLYDDSETIDVDDYGDDREIRYAGPIPHPNLED